MTIEFNFEKKFIVNGKEYDSLDEMPEDLRKAFQETMAQGRNIEVKTDTGIVFNGRAYKSLDAMEPNVRETYEKIMKAAGRGVISSKALTDLCIPLTNHQTGARMPGSRPIEHGPSISISFNGRSILIPLILVITALVLYFLVF